MTDGIKIFTNFFLDTDQVAKVSCGAEYEFSEETKVLVDFKLTTDMSKMQETIVLSQV